MKDLSLQSFLLIIAILFGCAAAGSKTSSKATSFEPTAEDAPGQWVDVSEGH